MTLESPNFALFFLGTLTAFWMLRKDRTAQKWLLLVLSCWFYGLLGWKFLALLGGNIVVNYWLGQRLGPEREDSSRWLRVGLFFNLGLLGFYKYYDFFRESLDDALAVLGLSSHLPAVHVVLPIGISFYTFQAIAYLVELHQGKGRRARSLLDFALFQSFFVQLLSGPICRGKHLLTQLEQPAPDRVPDPSRAAMLILSGLFKRSVLASALFTYGVADVFAAPDNYSAMTLWVAMIGYTVQIYCDFSGYTDLMRGMGLLLGFDIPDNFNHPYVATSVGEFWRRWHITFSNWLRDFIYFPLGGSHCPRHRTYLNLFATMFFCGIWHGAKWGFVIWGSLHGIALVMYKFGLDELRKRGIDPKKQRLPVPFRVAGWFWTFGVVCFSRVFFVTSDLGDAGLFLARMFDASVVGDGFSAVVVVATAVGLGLNFVGGGIAEGFVRVSNRVSLPTRAVIWTFCLIAINVLKPGGVAPNAYFGF